MRTAGSLMEMTTVFVFGLLLGVALISRALPYNLPCARGGTGSTDLSELGGRAFRVLSSPPHLQMVLRLLEDDTDVKEMLVVIESPVVFDMGMHSLLDAS